MAASRAQALRLVLEETFAKLSARANCGVVRYSEARLSH